MALLADTSIGEGRHADYKARDSTDGHPKPAHRSPFHSRLPIMHQRSPYWLPINLAIRRRPTTSRPAVAVVGLAVSNARSPAIPPLLPTFSWRTGTVKRTV
jgi:hypothetical protein